MSSKTTTSTLVCPTCGNSFPIMRRASMQRGKFHRKIMYCPKCKKETNHIEAMEIDKLMALLEFKEESDMSENEYRVYKLLKKKGE